MKEHIISKKQLSASSLLCCLTMALSGCSDDMSLPGFLQPKDDAPAASSVQRLNPQAGRDVESPEVFQVMEPGLWDGRPSLGGVWVAHPDVTEPERVIIRNTSNGNSVVGALFRKERDTPGPKIQVSSDAAAELGLLAGQPTDLDVTALRRVEMSDPAPTVLDAEDGGGLEAAPEIDATPLDNAPVSPDP